VPAGDPVIYIIGIDEKAGAVHEVRVRTFSVGWWAVNRRRGPTLPTPSVTAAEAAVSNGGMDVSRASIQLPRVMNVMCGATGETVTASGRR
jgi:hypothetical protein